MDREELLLEIESRYDGGGMEDAEARMSDLEDRMSNMEDAGRQAETGARAAESGFSALKTMAAGLIATLGLVAGAMAVGSLFGDAINETMAWSESMNLVQAQTGASTAEMAEFRDIAQDIYTSGWGDSPEAAAQAMAETQRITQSQGAELQNLTQDALILSEVFDYDVQESVRATDRAMKSFGEDGSDIMDMITYTAQRTGDPMDDLLDTVNEYSGEFAAAGYSADQMFNSLIKGSDTGGFSLDKTADMVKEFQLRTLDGSEEVRGAWDDLFATDADGFRFVDYENGIDTTVKSTEQLFTMIENGQIPVSIVGDRMAEMLQNVESDTERARLSTAFLGSQYEDLGDAQLEVFRLGDEGLTDYAGALDRAGEAMSQGMGPALETLRRKGMTIIADFLDPYVTSLAEQAIPAMEDFGRWLETDGVNGLNRIAQGLGEVIRFLGIVGTVIVAALGGKEAIFQAIGDAFQDIGNFVSTLSPESIMMIAVALGIMVGPAILAGIAALASGVMATALAFAPLLAVMALVVAYETNFLGLRDSVDQFSAAVRDGDAQGALIAVRDALSNVAEKALELIGIDVNPQESWEAWDGVADNIATIWENADKIPGALDAVQSSVTGVNFGDGLEAWKGIASNMKTIWENADKIPSALTGNLGLNDITVPEPLTTVGDIVSNIFDTVTSGKFDVGQWVTTNIIAPMVSSLSGLGGEEGENPFQNTLQNIFSQIATGNYDVIGWVSSNIISPIANALNFSSSEDGENPLVAAGAGFGSTLFDTLASTLPDASQWVTDNITNPLSNALAGLESIVKGAINGAIPNKAGIQIDIPNPLGGSLFSGGIDVNIPDPFPGFATGGLVGSGEWSVVGERGPELFRAPTAGRIISNHAAPSFLGGAGGGGSDTIIFEARIPVMLDGRQIYEAHVREERKRAKG